MPEDILRQQQVKQARTYSFVVRVLRLVLPLAVMGGVLALAVLPAVLERRQGSLPPSEHPRTRMTGTRFFGQDQGGNPLSLFADTIDLQDDGRVTLVRPSGEIQLASGPWVIVQAEQGLYREEDGQLTLQTAVELFLDNGYQVQTEQAIVQTVTGTVSSRMQTQVAGPTGVITATGFDYPRHTNGIIFHGPATLILN